MTEKQRALVREAIHCFATAGERQSWGPDKHCSVTEIAGRYFWTVPLPGDALVLGGHVFPLSTDITPCDEHLHKFEEVFG